MAFGFIFESVGGTEWLVLLGVVLIVVGPKNLPSAARKLGNMMSTLRRAADEFKRQLLAMDEEVRKTVDEAVKTDYMDTSSSSSSTAADASAPAADNGDGDRAETDYYGSAYSEGENPYPDESAYPGHEYDSEPAAAPADTAAPAEPAADMPAAGEAKAALSDEELRQVKITVSVRKPA